MTGHKPEMKHLEGKGYVADGDEGETGMPRYLQRVICCLSWANVTNATKEEQASLFDEIDEIIESKGRRWRRVLRELEKGGPDSPFSFLFEMGKAKGFWQPTDAVPSQKRGEEEPPHRGTDQGP